LRATKEQSGSKRAFKTLSRFTGIATDDERRCSKNLRSSLTQRDNKRVSELRCGAANTVGSESEGHELEANELANKSENEWISASSTAEPYEPS
jgi:hypothetical protein